MADRKAGDAFNEIPGSRLAAVMRRDAEGAESFAKRHDAGSWSTDAAEILSNPDVNVVYVATPPANHLEYGLAAAEAGKPCLIEKPAGRSLAELLQLREHILDGPVHGVQGIDQRAVPVAQGEVVQISRFSRRFPPIQRLAGI